MSLVVLMIASALVYLLFACLHNIIKLSQEKDDQLKGINTKLKEVIKLIEKAQR